MPNKEEKKRRRQVVQNLRREELQAAFARKPIADHDLKVLIDHLEATLFVRIDGQIMSRCDHTHNRCREFLKGLGTSNIDEICKWFGEYGGFCDCEVAYNVADYWYEHIRDA